MIKRNLIISAVGRTMREYYLDNWLRTPEAHDYNITLITDCPHRYNDPPEDSWPKVIAHQYFGARYNYHDKFIYALTIISKTKQPAFLWDADELHNFNKSISLYNENSDIPQVGRLWYDNAKLSHDRNMEWWFLIKYISSIGIKPKDIKPIQEDKIWFPALDYTQTIKVMEDIRAQVHVNHRPPMNKWNVNGQGEGVALATGLVKSEIPIKLVGEYK